MDEGPEWPVPYGLNPSTPTWAVPDDVDESSNLPINKDVRAYLSECLSLLPNRVIYCPEQQCVVGMRGSMRAPDSYAEYPMLSIYFAKHRMKKYPFDALRNGIVWPEPYVVLNTIMRRLKTHRFLKENPESEEIPERIRNVIAPGLEIPPGSEGDLLEVTYQDRKTAEGHLTKIFEGPEAKQDLDGFFDGLLGPDHASLYHNKTRIRVSSSIQFRSNAERLQVAQFVRKVWYVEKILSLTKKISEESQSVISDPEAVWDILADLQNEWTYNSDQDSIIGDVAIFIKTRPSVLEEFREQLKESRLMMYAKIRNWLPKGEKFKIYRGTTIADDGSVKVSLNFTEHAQVTSAFVALKVLPLTGQNFVYKVEITFECRYMSKTNEG